MRIVADRCRTPTALPPANVPCACARCAGEVARCSAHIHTYIHMFTTPHRHTYVEREREGGREGERECVCLYLSIYLSIYDIHPYMRPCEAAHSSTALTAGASKHSDPPLRAQRCRPRRRRWWRRARRRRTRRRRRRSRPCRRWRPPSPRCSRPKGRRRLRARLARCVCLLAYGLRVLCSLSLSLCE